MDRVVAVCTRLPCEIRATGHSTHAGISTLDLALPFAVDILIIVLSIFTSHEVNLRAKAYFIRDADKQEIDDVPGHISPLTIGQALPWIIDNAQIPSIVGTPLVALLVLRHTYALHVIVLYLGVVVAGIIIFLIYLRNVKIYDYENRGKTKHGFQVSPLAKGGIALNLVAMVIAMIVIK